MKKPKPRAQLKARGFDGSAVSRQRIEKLTEPRPGTWSMLPAAAVCDRSLGRCSPLHVLAWLCKYRNTRTGECYPSVETMAADLGIEARSVQRHMDTLIKCGHVVVIPRVNKSTGKQTSNMYYVLYGDVPAPADREAAPDADQEAGDAPKPSDGAVMAFGDGVTSSVTLTPSGVTPSVTPKPKNAPGRGDTECQGGVTSSVARGDVKCHPNYPTDSIPLNDPSAEADALARVAAASDDADGEVGKGTADTEPDQSAQHEARQEVPLPKVRDMRPPSPPRDPVGDAVRWIAKAGGFEVAQVWVAAMEWHTTLVSAGLSDQEAQLTIAAEANLLKAFNEHDDLVRKMGKRAQEIFDGGPSALPIKPSASTQARSKMHV